MNLDDIKSSFIWVMVLIVIIGIEIYGYFTYNRLNNALNSISLPYHNLQVINHTYKPEIVTYRYTFQVINPSGENIYLSGRVGFYDETVHFASFDINNELARAYSESVVSVDWKHTFSEGGTTFHWKCVDTSTYNGYMEARCTILGVIPITVTKYFSGNNTIFITK